MTDFDFNSSFREVPIFENYTPYFGSSDDAGDRTSSSASSSVEVVVLACVYTIVFGVGLFGNGSLLVALLSQQSIRSKNALLIGLCVADLLVCTCSGPLAATRPSHGTTTGRDCATTSCVVLTYLEGFPVSASTLSLMMLAVDRYATVHHSRALPYLQRRPFLLAFSLWIIAAALAVPYLVAESSPRVTQILCSSPSDRYNFTTTTSGTTLDRCPFDVAAASGVAYALLALATPALVTLACHARVRAKLCALSLTARAAHGELPLPMPLLRRPTHVIIVAGMTTTAAAMNGDDREPQGGGVRGQQSRKAANRESVRYECDNGDGRRRSRKHHRPPSGGPQRGTSQRRTLNPGTNASAQDGSATPIIGGVAPKPSLLTTQPQTSTLQSRRRLGNVLVSVAAAFAACWLPHAAARLCLAREPNADASPLRYTLLLGHAHSALNPVVYWALNHAALRQQQHADCCSWWCCCCCRAAHRFLFRFKRAGEEQPPSSTNEAALGAFHPRYTRARPVIERAAPSSHYLY